MLKKIEIKNFKSVKYEVLDFKPLTFFTGTNSAGKSSILQAILLNAYIAEENQLLKPAVDFLFGYENIRNYNLRENKSQINLILNETETKIICNADEDWKFDSSNVPKLIFEENLYYLWSNRTGQEDIVRINKKAKFDIDGKYAFSYFYRNLTSFLELDKLAKKNFRCRFGPIR